MIVEPLAIVERSISTTAPGPATWAYSREPDPRKLQRLMRHGSIQTSMGYVHGQADVLGKLPALSHARLMSV